MEIFLINLARSHDRLSHMRAVFNAQGLAFERIDAVDAATLSEDFVRNIVVPPISKYARNLTPSEVACYLSHKKVWEMALSRGLEYAAIFEDDIHLAPDAGKLLSTAAEWLPDGADLIKLETLAMRTHVSRSGSVLMDTPHRLKKLLSSHYGSAGYIISRRAMERLCAASDPLPLPVDDVIFGAHYRVFGRLSAYQIDPAICVQDQYLEGPGTERLGIASIIYDRHASPPLKHESNAPVRRALASLSNKMNRRRRKTRIALLQALGRAEQKTIPFARD
ncbi:glycosyltransferase family 25 protein [Martelella mediterranea]|uniref:glycosyltransferase family 25 protein n=1 Tax=Martelella mediterranea TaxID=293089 RepID=UPI001E3D7994|nr:glycosyltransferase family 25 protein [Martelella mediterranea]MCD1633268.1 glycosyltransferase family 25 protein [Martelella mediterranea]